MGPAKLKKAEKLGIALLTEEEFIAMLANGAPPAGTRDAHTGTAEKEAAQKHTETTGKTSVPEAREEEAARQGELF